MWEGRSLLTVSVGKTSCNSTENFLRVTLEAFRLMLLLRLLWPLFQLLQLQSERDLLCVLHLVGPG